MKINCLRRQLNTDGTVLKEWFETHEATVIWHGGNLNSWWIRLSPGVTGYESVAVDAVLKSKGSWPACAGTPGSWDFLGVLEIDMDRLRDALSLLPFPELSSLMLFMQTVQSAIPVTAPAVAKP